MIMQPPERCEFDIADATKTFFGKQTPLANISGYGSRPYEYRSQQGDMAYAVASALAESSNLCVEAPTGIGKSFAYLVPAIYYAVSEKKPVLITTETINLQEQLITKDIPLLKKVIDHDFKSVLAKGRSNYVCIRRLALASGANGDEYLPLTTMMTQLETIKTWARNTQDGTLSSLNLKVEQRLWSYVCCEGGNCAGPKCSHFRSCFYWNARKEWEKADIIVANHALFFTDLKIRHLEKQETGNTLLPAYGAVVIDEAHTMEDNAASHLGLRIRDSGLHYFLNKLFNPQNGKGLLVRKGEEALEARTLVAKIQDRASTFFGTIGETMTDYSDSLMRVRNRGVVADTLSEELYVLKKRLKSYSLTQDDDDFKTELESQMLKCDFYSEGIHDFLNMTMEESVYWIENRNSGGKSEITLYAAPLNVPTILDKLIFESGLPTILTSATLSVRGNLEYYTSRTGYSGRELILDSPFDHEKQTTIYIPKSMPEPNMSQYTETAIEEIKKCVLMTHGKAFVLFTSYHMMRECSDKLKSFFDANKMTLLVQGEDRSRSAMLAIFKEDTNSVIFGTTSFWTGVDVPGEALSNVVITKLPFAVPNHPLIEARSEKITALGGNPFMHYALPEAVLKFRQGTGRLIRSKSDKGIIAILDKRVISKRYGRYFLDSIPKCPTNIC